ncbi:hypothetical protein JTE90_013040 [Oedothorax gibbosus]|uniref:Uncharacterized protein n=1 Tax=Oedothorax gibbosus TaxID=931172 RepID=A0AAV6UGM1_9ARAC|nr:hypothetical protein JTE90_013040 [Oedothorax gibbosus]
MVPLALWNGFSGISYLLNTQSYVMQLNTFDSPIKRLIRRDNDRQPPFCMRTKHLLSIYGFPQEKARHANDKKQKSSAQVRHEGCSGRKPRSFGGTPLVGKPDGA